MLASPETARAAKHVGFVNRVRRRLRSIVSKHGERVRPGRYLVMIARFRAAEADLEQLERDWLQVVKRLGVMGDGP